MAWVASTMHANSKEPNPQTIGAMMDIDGKQSEGSETDHRSDSERDSNEGDVQQNPVAAEKKKKKKKKGKSDRGIGSSRGVETMFKSTYRVHMDLTALADSKANIMISINGLILSIILASIAPKIDSNNWLFFPTTFLLMTCVSSIIYAILAARPRVNARSVNMDDITTGRVSLLFFGNYTQFDEDTFIASMRSLADDQELVYKIMMRDLYGIGTVLSKKFALLHRAYTIFMFGITLSVVAFIIVFFLQSYWIA